MKYGIYYQMHGEMLHSEIFNTKEELINHINNDMINWAQADYAEVAQLDDDYIPTLIDTITLYDI